MLDDRTSHDPKAFRMLLSTRQHTQEEDGETGFEE